MKIENKENRLRLSKKEMKELIKTYDGKLDAGFSEETLNDTYILNDKRDVVSFQSLGFLYNSIDELKMWMDYLSNKKMKPEHILDNKFLYDLTFPKFVPELIELIIDQCKLIEEPPSLGSVRLIDVYIENNYFEIKDNNKFFSALIAYVGESLKNSMPDSEWGLVQSEMFPTIWEPYILHNNKRYNVYLPVYREIFEEFPETKKVSIYDRVIMELNS